MGFASLMEECGNEGSLHQHRLAPDVTGCKLANGLTVAVAVLAETYWGGGRGGSGGQKKRRVEGKVTEHKSREGRRRHQSGFATDGC